MPRRLGFDAVRALRNATGLGNYARGVLRGLHAAAPDDTLLLYTPRAAAPEFADLAASLHAEVRRAPASTMGGAWWRTFRAGRQAARDAVTLYHGLSHQLPRDLPATGVPSVVTFHDLIYERSPELFPAPDRLSYRWRYRWSARHADAIVAVSSTTCDDLVEWYGVDRARIAVVPPACDPAFGTDVGEAGAIAVRQRLGLPEQYLLSVGTLERRKNHAVLIAAMALLPPTTPPLLLVGRDGGQRAALEREIVRQSVVGRVRILGDVGAGELPALMQGASLFLYPSRLEGFGMPIVEAMAAGQPVIAAAVASLIDAAGPAAVLVDPFDAPAWAAAIAGLLDDPAERSHRQALGRSHAARFDEVGLARQLEAVYDAVIAGAALPVRTLANEVVVETAP